jgi:serine/threonine protein kinase
MAEMLLGDTPFQGDREISQLMKIFEKLGRPTQQDWPEVAMCENFHDSFPRWPRPPNLSHVRFMSHYADYLHVFLLLRAISLP